MKRADLLRHLEQHGCVFLREGGRHSVYVNRATRKTSTVPRHREINDLLRGRSAKTSKSQKSKTSKLSRNSGGAFGALASGARSLSGRDDERPHHVVVFVLDDVAVMHIALRSGYAGG